MLRRGVLVVLFAAGALACGGDVDLDSPEPKSGLGVVVSDLRADYDSLAVDDTDVYVAGRSGIARISKAGGLPVALRPVGEIEGIALDEAYVYFTIPLEGVVARIPKVGGREDVIATGQNRPRGITVDADRVYWANEGDYDIEALEKPPTGQIVSAPKTGGPVTVLVRDEQAPMAITTHGDDLYWVDSVFGGINGMVRRVPKNGGEAVTIAEGIHTGGFAQIAVVGERIVWSELEAVCHVAIGGGPVERIPRRGPFAVEEGAIYLADRNDRSFTVTGYRGFPDLVPSMNVDVHRFGSNVSWFARHIALDRGYVYTLDYRFSYSKNFGPFTAVRRTPR